MWKDLQNELKANTEYIIQDNEKHILKGEHLCSLFFVKKSNSCEKTHIKNVNI